LTLRVAEFLEPPTPKWFDPFWITKNDDEPTSFTPVRNEADLIPRRERLAMLCAAHMAKASCTPVGNSADSRGPIVERQVSGAPESRSEERV
jgi:hypothetical protein